MSLKVAFNGRSNAAGRQRTGVERWARNVRDKLSNLAAIRDLSPGGRGRGIRGHMWEQTVLPREFNESKSDVLLSPANWGPVVTTRQLVVVHDLAPLILSKHFPRSYVAQAHVVLPLLARRARLATVSSRSQADICEYFSLRAEDVAVLGCGYDKFPEPDSSAVPRSPYFLFVGAHDRRKNVGFLLKMWPRIFSKCGAKLAVTSQGSSSTFQEFQHPQNSQWLSVIQSPTDNQLAALYGNCVAVLQPSLYEGFGLPALEALGSGRPFLSANVGAAADLQTAGCFVLDLDPDDWTDVIVECTSQIEIAEAQQSLLKKAEEFTWTKTADKVMRVIAEMQS